MQVTLRNANGDPLWTGTGVASLDAADDAGAHTPVLQRLDPAVVVLGSPDLTLHCYGEGFAEGAEILWAGTPEPTTRVSSRELTTGINMATASTPVTLGVSVRNPGGDESVALAFRFDAAAGR